MSKTKCIVLGLIIGIAVPSLAVPFIPRRYLPRIHLTPKISCDDKYPLTNRDLDCPDPNEAVDTLKSIESDVQSTVDSLVKNGDATRISVWVRDLNTNQFAAVNEFETYAPASMFKVPVMITYFKFAQIEPDVLQKKVLYEKASDQDNSAEYFKSGSLLQVGQEYTVEQMIEAMITTSDNNAADILIRHLDIGFYKQTLLELGLQIPKDGASLDFVTAKTYANIYRMLFNASYLNREYSEKALDILNRSEFKGIADPLPADVPVAHKFGERQFDTSSGATIRELHDCGVVYKKRSPYTVCIFTEGKDYDTLLSDIKDISKLVYDQMN